MNDIKSVIAKNIIELRRTKGMTQLELAEKLNYSDKAVSKWEHADSMPDIAVLVEIADLFEVSLDYLVRAEHGTVQEQGQEKKKVTYRRNVIAAIAMSLVWLIATFVFVMLSFLLKDSSFRWLCYLYAVPVEMIIWLVFNSIWFNRKLNYFIISVLVWSILASIHISLLLFGINASLIYLLGIPGQSIILLWKLMWKPKN